MTMKFRKLWSASSSVLVLFCFVCLCSNNGRHVVAAAGLFHRNDGDIARSQQLVEKPSSQQDYCHHPPPPLPPIEEAARFVVQPSSQSELRPSIRHDSKASVQALLAKARSTSERFAARRSSDAANFINSVHYRIRRRQGRLSLGEATEKDLLKTTRLSGGAESETTREVPEDTEASSSSSSNAAKPNPPKSRKAFLPDIGRKKPRFPKASTPNLDVRKRMQDGLQLVQQTGSKVGPPFLSALSLLYHSDKGISFLSLYALSLLGASCGFHLFLYFITVGYALGITLPMTAALHVYNKHVDLSRQTILNSVLTIAWGVRLVSFLLWREFVSWPALHKTVVGLQSRMTIPFFSRLLCWFVYSLFYVAMVSMSWSRLEHPSSPWGVVGHLGLLFQIAGLALETIADLQKNGFKSQHRHAWCNVGVWRWSTHPNYLGEGMFWWGSYLAHGFCSIPHSLLATIGLMFITVVLKGSTRSLSLKQLEKYGELPEFCEFYRTHGVWGPKHWWWWLQGMQELSTPQTNNNNATAVATDENGNIIPESAPAEEAQCAQPVS